MKIILTFLIGVFLFLLGGAILVSIVRFLIFKDEIEYDEHGKIKMRGERRFNKRNGHYKFFDNEEKVYLKIIYRNGGIICQQFINTQNGQIWKLVDPINNYVSINLKYADELTRSNREMILEGFQMGYIHSSDLDYVSDDLKNDREIVLKSLSHNGYSLGYTSDDLKNDREIVLKSVSHNGASLKYASDDLKNDREIVATAFKSHYGASTSLKYASDDLINDKNFLLQLARENPKEALNLHFNLPSKYFQDNDFLIELFPLIDKKNEDPHRLFYFLFKKNKKEIKLQNKTLFFVGKIWLNLGDWGVGIGCIGLILGICLGWIMTFLFWVFLSYTLIHMLNIPSSNPWVNLNDTGVFLFVLAMLPGFGMLFLLIDLMKKIKYKIGWNIYSKLIGLRINKI